MRVFVITGIYHSLALLPHFVRFYSSVGIKHYLFHHNTEIISSSDVDNSIKNTGIEATCLHWDGPNNYRLQHFWRLKLQREFVRESDWVVIADLDEFIDFRPFVQDVLTCCEQTGCNWVVGEFVDRISESGKLIDIDPAVNIFEQFPKESEISRKILLAPYKRTVAIKGGYYPMHNCYEYDDAITAGLNQESICRWPKILKIHHFKWHTGVVKMLKQRSERYQKLSKDNSLDYEEPFRQCERFLRYYAEHERLPILAEDLQRL